MTNKQQARADRVKRNTKLIEESGFSLHYFSKIHVRIDDRVDLWLSTGTWHIKNQKSESKCYDEMIKYLGGKMKYETNYINHKNKELVKFGDVEFKSGEIELTKRITIGNETTFYFEVNLKPPF